jgi:hypothetical protein
VDGGAGGVLDDPVLGDAEAGVLADLAEPVGALAAAARRKRDSPPSVQLAAGRRLSVPCTTVLRSTDMVLTIQIARRASPSLGLWIWPWASMSNYERAPVVVLSPRLLSPEELLPDFLKG